MLDAYQHAAHSAAIGDSGEWLGGLGAPEHPGAVGLQAGEALHLRHGGCRSKRHGVSRDHGCHFL